MPDVSAPRPARRVLLAGGLLAVALGAGAVWAWGDATRLDAGAFGGGTDATPPRTTEDLLAWVREHDGASLVVWDVAGDSAVVSIRPDAERPVAVLTGLLLAVELSRRAGRGLDTAAVLPASVVERRRLPGVEPPRPARASSLADLARRALASDRAAADALLWTLGREATDALPARLGLGVEAPLPLDGLLLAWAPADRPGPRDSLVAAFLALDRASQRDSAFARSLSYVESPAVRAAEQVRLERDGLGLARDGRRAAVRATFPRGTARAYARLLAQAVRGDLVDAEVSACFLDLVTRPAADSLRGRGGRRLGVVGGGASGLVGTAGVFQTERGGRVAVLLLEDAPSATAPPAWARRLVRDLVVDDRLGAHPTGGAGRS